MKYACIRAHRNRFPVTLMCRLLGVSRAGFYAAERRSPSVRAKRNESLRAVIGAIYETSRGTYGSPRIHREMRAAGERCGRKRIARLMRESGLKAKRRRGRRPTTTESKHGYGVRENILRRRFGVEETGGLNQAWCGDITYIRTGEGWLYLAVLLDLGSRMIVGWAMRETLEADLSLDALRMAIARRNPGPGLVHHTDQGGQYAAIEYQELLASKKMISSMSGRANCYDNAVSESFFATLKWELIDRRKWRTRREARSAIFEYVEVWYNRQRRHSSLDYLSPLQYEQRLLSAAA